MIGGRKRYQEQWVIGEIKMIDHARDSFISTIVVYGSDYGFQSSGYHLCGHYSTIIAEYTSIDSQSIATLS